jgi:hypothetical protein
MSDYIEPLLWAAGAALIVCAILVGPDLLDLLPDAKPGKWVSIR